MKISIITVCLNSVDTILDTIRSVSSQSYKNIEHIIIDGGSDDGTIQLVNGHLRTGMRLVSQKDDGIYDAMNRGLHLATGSVVGFLNSDDVFDNSDVVSDIINSFDDISVDGCYGDIIFSSRGNLGVIRRFWRAGLCSPTRLKNGWMPPHPTFYVRKSVYDEVGDFDVSYSLQADFDMAVRMIYGRGVRLRYIPKVMVKMRMGGASNSSVANILRGNLESYQIARIHGLGISPLFIFKKIISRLPQFFVRPNNVGDGQK